MLLPSIFGENLLDDWMDFPRLDFGDIDRKLYGKRAAQVMKTDVHEHDDKYELDIDLPGFKKDEIKLSLENGYLSVSAAKGLDKDEKNKKGKIIRQERYAGAIEDGVLKLSIPKNETEKLPEKQYIAIEG